MADLKWLPVPYSIEDKDLRDWLEQFQRNMVEMSSTAEQFDVRHSAPAKPREGLVVYADGTDWNPGFGAGLYEYTGTLWRLLSAAGYTYSKQVSVGGEPAAGTAPTKVFLNNIIGWKFAIGNDFYFNIAIPSDWNPGTDFSFEAHFYSTNVTAGRYIQWSLDWRAVAMGERISAPGSSGTLNTGDILLPTTSDQLSEVAFAAISGSSVAVHDHLLMHITRIASSGTAPAAADHPVLVHFELEYTAKGFGA